MQKPYRKSLTAHPLESSSKIEMHLYRRGDEQNEHTYCLDKHKKARLKITGGSNATVKRIAAAFSTLEAYSAQRRLLNKVSICETGFPV